MKQEKKYNLKVGAIVCLFLSLLISISKAIRSDYIDYRDILLSISYTFGMAFLCWVIHSFFISAKLPWKAVDTRTLKFSLSIVTGVLVAINYYGIVSHFIAMSHLPNEFQAPIKKSYMLLFRGSIISGFVFFAVYYLNLITVTQRSRIENEQLKKQNLQARLNSLKQQISPHFLFNTLNTLSSLTKEPRVKDYIAEISNVYRYLLQYKENDLVTVAEELKFVESYLYILNERFEQGLQVNINISETIMKTSLPPLALQTLVENAIKHNIISAGKPLHLKIINDDKSIIVSNNLQLKQSLPSESSNSGLNNINERYQLLTNRAIVIERTEHDFIVKLPVLI